MNPTMVQTPPWRARAEAAEAEVDRLRTRILAIDTGKVIAASQLELLQDELRATSASLPVETTANPDRRAAK